MERSAHKSLCEFLPYGSYGVPTSFYAYIMNRRGEMKMIEKQGLMTYKLWNTLQKSKIVNPCSIFTLNVLHRCGYTVAYGRREP